MYEPWLKAADKPSPALPSYSFGKHLRPRARKIAVAIIGIDAEVAKKTREHLFSTSWAFGKLVVRDLGNLRKTSPDFVIPLLRELHTAGITPVLIGASSSAFTAQYLAFAELNRQVSLLNIDRSIKLNPVGESGEVLDNAVHNKGRRRFHLSHLGAQQHLVDPAIFDLFNAQAYEAISLGPARSSIPALEPLLRDADLVGLNIESINYHEAPARAGLHPSGFSLQEASQLAYYAGNSDKLSSFGLYGLDPEAGSERDAELSAAAYAQLIWYFLQGFSRRQGDFPASSTGMLEYLVDIDDFDKLTFWRSPRSNRWWVQVPASNKKGEERHRLVPCRYEDYLEASSKQTLPDRLMAAFRRYV
ncbi:hypothetical protein FUA23_02140 [Neolewinella aurantiaca]|uniref:Arginase n=1 Tax=Neolewinella aurantiaca TaxID=2602767 RepID=A0A5C7FXK7_9BACT|nr:hypothetical protein [Neolewinella aurantiaca]TXF91518.1 hypothetical protein FUA23_02140 [Neolewinella aurantiaca]